jgi:hypothetical protein
VTKPTQPVAQTKIRRQGRTISVEMMDLTADDELTSADEEGSTVDE